MLGLFIPGPPQPLRRHRHGRGMTYDPPENKANKRFIRRMAETAMQSSPELFPLQGPICCEIYALFKRPKSVPKKRLFPAVKPDVDNLVKLVYDSLNPSSKKDREFFEGVWNDDAQVCIGPPHKLYAPDDEPEGVWVFVWELHIQDEANAQARLKLLRAEVELWK